MSGAEGISYLKGTPLETTDLLPSPKIPWNIVKKIPCFPDKLLRNPKQSEVPRD